MEKMKKSLRYLDVILFMTLVPLKFCVYNKIIAPQHNFFSVFIPVLTSIILIASFSFLFNRKGRSKFLFIVNIVLSSFLIADINYFRYYKDVITIPVIRNGILLGAVNDAVKDIVKPQDFLLLLDIFAITIGKRILNRKNNVFKEALNDIYQEKKNLNLRFVTFAIIFVIGFGSNSYFIHNLRVTQPRLAEGMYNKIYISRAIGNINCHFLDLQNFTKKNLFGKKTLNDGKQEEIKKYLVKKNEKKGENFKNVGEGKNLIIIQIESFQEFIVNRTVNGKEITPNLNKWIKRSMYFDNYYCQVAGGNTSDAEFMANNSLYPASSGAAYYIYSGNEFNSLPKLFKEKDYSAYAFHGFKDGFWNRNVMYKQEGFNKFYGENSFNIDEKVGLGLSDKSFFNQTFDFMQKDLKDPYYSLIITLTSHYPFNDVQKYGEFNVGELEGTFMGNYLKSVHYTDEQLGMFMDKLEKDGTLDNSIVVMYGDHFAISKDRGKELYDFLGIKEEINDYNWEKLQKTPLLFHFPKDEHKGEVNHIYAGQMDLLPTIVNMFGLENKYMFGQDIFNENDRFIVFRSGAFLDGKVYFASSSGKYYDWETGKEVEETKELKEKKEKALKQLDYSDTLLDHNLLKKWGI